MGPVHRLAIGFSASLGALIPMTGHAEPLRATSVAPVTVPIVRHVTAEAAKTGAHRVIVTVAGFAPSPSGPVEIVVVMPCDGGEREIGRFGVLPASGFTGTDRSRWQHFGLPLPAGCDSAEHLRVRVVARQGDGKGAHVDIDGAEIR